MGNKEIYCTFKTYCIISVLFFKKWHLFHNFFFVCSSNTHFFINHVLNFKYQPGQLNINITCSLGQITANVRTSSPWTKSCATTTPTIQVWRRLAHIYSLYKTYIWFCLMGFMHYQFTVFQNELQNIKTTALILQCNCHFMTYLKNNFPY